MKRTITSFVASLLLLAASAQTVSPQREENSETLQHTQSWAATLQKAKQENKLIFVDCYFTGCFPCAQMDKEVFPNEQVKTEMEKNFVGIKIDVYKEKLGDTINMKYGITGYPTFLILNQEGQLLSMFTGYKDAGLLLQELKTAKMGNPLSGFAISNTVSYPDFYKKYFDKEDRKADPVAANAWIKVQKDWTSEPVAMAIFRTRQLDATVEEYMLINAKTYFNNYGESLVMGKLSDILSSQLDKLVGTNGDEAKFRSFLAEKSKLFPKEEWRTINFLLGYKYYGSVAKDTLGLLKFINEDPIVYANYIGALYSTMTVKKQLNEATLKFLCDWASKAVNEESAFDLIRTAAYFHKQNKDMEGFKKFINMAISKAKKYNVPAEGYEKMLVQN